MMMPVNSSHTRENGEKTKMHANTSQRPELGEWAGTSKVEPDCTQAHTLTLRNRHHSRPIFSIARVYNAQRVSTNNLVDADVLA
jgi:hypothetical protein